MARHLVELGYHTTGETLKREEFEMRKKAEREKHLHKENVPKPLASLGKDLKWSPLMQALANREELVRNGKLTVRERAVACVFAQCTQYWLTSLAGGGSASFTSVTPTSRARKCRGTLTSATG